MQYSTIQCNAISLPYNTNANAHAVQYNTTQCKCKQHKYTQIHIQIHIQIPIHCITLHYITLHYIPLPELSKQVDGMYWCSLAIPVCSLQHFECASICIEICQWFLCRWNLTNAVIAARQSAERMDLYLTGKPICDKQCLWDSLFEASSVYVSGNASVPRKTNRFWMTRCEA